MRLVIIVQQPLGLGATGQRVRRLAGTSWRHHGRSYIWTAGINATRHLIMAWHQGIRLACRGL